jgi:CRP/FNR family transcriptional regulator, cyclic AMP receptor protein
VSSFINKFRQLSFVDYNGHLQVRSSLLNVVLHEPHVQNLKRESYSVSSSRC